MPYISWAYGRTLKQLVATKEKKALQKEGILYCSGSGI